MSKVLKVLEHYEIEVSSQNKCCCPIHQEDTPSFQYYEDTDSWYCWGKCGTGGDYLELIKNLEECDFKKAIKLAEEILGEKVVLGDKEVKKRSTKTESPPELPISVLKEIINDTEYQNLKYRGIRKETDEFFKHRSKIVNGKIVKRYYPETNDDGAICGLKCRNIPKDFTHGKIGSTGAKSQLSGQFKYKAPGKYVLIVGGEDDKAAAHQMFQDYQKSRKQEDLKVCDVVSSTVGEGTAAKQCAAQYDFLDGYENIIIGLDNDEAGRKAAKEILKVLPKEKLKFAQWSEKDPHQMLEKGMSKQFIRDFYNAKDIVATGIKNALDSFEEVKEFLTAPKIPLPPHLHKVQEAHRGGLRSSGFIGSIIADTSVGKTFVTDTLLNFWIPMEEVTPIIVSIERTAGELTADLLSIHLKKNLTWYKDGQDAVDLLETPEVKTIVDDFLTDEYGRPRFYVIDERDGSVENLQNKMKAASAKYSTNLFIIDPLTDILRSLGNDAQEDHMMWQKQRKKDGWKIINVLHTRKPLRDKKGKLIFVTEYDALGSSTFVQSADWNWVLNRDKMAEDEIERNTMYLGLPKVRNGTTGLELPLYYDKATRQHYDKEDYFSGKYDEEEKKVVKEEEEEPPTGGVKPDF